MLYTVTLDKDNYILSIGNSLNDNVELDLSKLELKYLNAYKLINGVVSLDENRKAEMVAEEEEREKEIEIADLTSQLESTDEDLLSFVEDLFSLKNPLTFITDLIGLMKNYSTLVADRLAIRKRIEELRK